ncbi:hypothetical protein NC652_034460 [Populus alba x Populus x berolinensis]|nr:hypothetical protein NC652_034460 [Populus alba x Populus x berolinensis]
MKNSFSFPLNFRFSITYSIITVTPLQYNAAPPRRKERGFLEEW